MKTKSKSSKLLKIFVFGVLGSIGLVVSAWALFNVSMTGMVISSSGGVDFSEDFGITNHTSGDSDFTKIEILNITNNGGNRIAQIFLNDTIYDVSDDCIYSNDTEFKVYLNGNDWEELSDGEYFNISEGKSFIQVDTKSIAWSCPHEATLELRISE